MTGGTTTGTTSGEASGEASGETRGKTRGTADGVTGRVVVVGDLVTDVLVLLAEPLAVGSDAAARIRTCGGGQAANTAAWLAREGVPVTLVAAVGDDPAGAARIAELTAAGVDCAVRRVAGVPTGTLVVLSSGLADTAERSMLADRGAADRLRPIDVDTALGRASQARHLHLSGYALLGAGSRAAGRHALAAARTRGLTTSVDAASAAPLRRADGFLEWVRGADLLFANAAEAEALVPAAPGAPDRARALRTYAAAVVVKLGAAGALWAGEGALAREPAAVDTVAAAGAAAEPMVDATGAGDAFAAGLLAAWLAGAEPATALRAGARLGARAVSAPGARPPR